MHRHGQGEWCTTVAAEANLNPTLLTPSHATVYLTMHRMSSCYQSVQEKVSNAWNAMQRKAKATDDGAARGGAAAGGGGGSGQGGSSRDKKKRKKPQQPKKKKKKPKKKKKTGRSSGEADSHSVASSVSVPSSDDEDEDQPGGGAATRTRSGMSDAELSLKAASIGIRHDEWDWEVDKPQQLTTRLKLCAAAVTEVAADIIYSRLHPDIHDWLTTTAARFTAYLEVEGDGQPATADDDNVLLFLSTFMGQYQRLRVRHYTVAASTVSSAATAFDFDKYDFYRNQVSTWLQLPELPPSAREEGGKPDTWAGVLHHLAEALYRQYCRVVIPDKHPTLEEQMLTGFDFRRFLDRLNTLQLAKLYDMTGAIVRKVKSAHGTSDKPASTTSNRRPTEQQLKRMEVAKVAEAVIKANVYEGDKEQAEDDDALLPTWMVEKKETGTLIYSRRPFYMLLLHIEAIFVNLLTFENRNRDPAGLFPAIRRIIESHESVRAAYIKVLRTARRPTLTPSAAADMGSSSSELSHAEATVLHTIVTYYANAKGRDYAAQVVDNLQVIDTQSRLTMKDHARRKKEKEARRKAAAAAAAQVGSSMAGRVTLPLRPDDDEHRTATSSNQPPAPPAPTWVDQRRSIVSEEAPIQDTLTEDEVNEMVALMEEMERDEDTTALASTMVGLIRGPSGGAGQAAVGGGGINIVHI